MVQMAHLVKKLDIRFAAVNAVPSWICTAAGTCLLVLADSAGLKQALAVMLISLALHRVRKRCHDDANRLPALDPLVPAGSVLPPPPAHSARLTGRQANGQANDDAVHSRALQLYEHRGVWAKSGLDLATSKADLTGVVLCGVGIGLLGGIFGVGGPPGMLFVSFYDSRLDLDVWRAVSAVRRFGMSAVRLIIFTVGGQLDISHKYPLYISVRIMSNFSSGE